MTPVTPDSLAVLAGSAWLLFVCFVMMRRGARELLTTEIQKMARRSNRPLRFTSHAAEQCAREGLNVEWVETTLAFPTASGVVRGGPTVWFMREFGNKRVRVLAINQQAHRTPGVIHVEVTPIYQGSAD